MANIDSHTKRRKLNPRQEPYWHKLGKYKYLGVRRTETDEDTWYARATLKDAKKVTTRLARVNELDFDEASEQAHIWFKQLDTNQIVNTESHSKAKKTVSDVVYDYVHHLKIHNSADAADRTNKQLQKHLIPTLGNVEINKLTTTRIRNWFNSLVRLSDDDDDVRKSKDSANRVLSMVKAAFNKAFKDGLVHSNAAWQRVSPFKNVGASRRLFLTDEQISALYEASDRDLHSIIKGAVFTGTRIGELKDVQVGDFDADGGLLQVTKGKTGARIVYLQDAAVRFFKEETENKPPDAYIFLNGTNQWSADDMQRPFKAAARQAKLPLDTVFYSLRHYHISKALLAGLPPQVVAENCGTSIRMLEKHYGKFLPKDRRKMLNQVALSVV